MIVTYPDGSKEEVHVTVHVTDNAGQGEQDKPTTNNGGNNGTAGNTGNGIGNTNNANQGQSAAKNQNALPQTGNDEAATMSLVGVTMAAALGLLGLKKRKED
ncbi:LPXTG cell wall anchor domain-containing protein [Lactobacillus sp. 3B(2020)]|nr:LPXTG cell wall anchor domain-containing protein [Lactobacillus sp. 3B(2020)]